jgi:peptide/nickel transport system permease protein
MATITTPPAGDDDAPVAAAVAGEAVVNQPAERYEASQWRLVWWAFRKHRLAVAGAVVVLAIYLVALFAEFLAPYAPSAFNSDYTYAPPQRPHILDTSGDGWDLGLYVHGYTSSMDPESLAITYEIDESEKIELGFFVKGAEYELWGLIPWDRHFLGPKDPDQSVFLLGADRNGRDMLSRIVYGARVSMTIGLVGVALAFVLGITLGGISGYLGGKIDTLIQRMVEFFMSVPTLPLWLGLAAALPHDWSPLRRYFAITVILAIVAWTELARVVRGRFLSLREETFVTAAHLDGNSQPRVIFRHMLPSFTSHLVAALTLSVPTMIIAETALSFLGLGLLPPVVSWGVLLQEAQNIRVVATAPWLMLPGLAVVVAVLSLNFVGDGLRDAADPYRR